MMDGVHWQLHPASAFSEFERVWDEFNAATFQLPLLSAALMHTGLRHFGNGDEHLAIATDDRGTAALCLIRNRGAPQLTTFQPSQFPVGPWLQRSDLGLPGLAGSLLQHRSKRAALASLTQLDPMFVPRPADAALITSLGYISTGTIDLPESLDDYMATRSENLLANLRRREHKINREHGRIVLEVLEQPAEVARGIDIYSDLESAGWKGRLGTALGKGNVQWRFYQEALASLAREGNARVYILRAGDELAAASFAIVAAHCVYLLKTTHNERLRSIAPGMILRSQFIQSLYEREAGVRRVEIYGALNDSQRPWVTSTREMYSSNVYRGSAIGSLHALWRRMARPFRGNGEPQLTRRDRNRP